MKGYDAMIRTIYDDMHVLEWHDDITLKNVEQFRQEIANFLNVGSKRLILSLANTNYINSAGLGIIADSVMQARRNTKELVIANIQQSVKEIFSIVKFSSFMKLFDSEQQAIEFFQSK